MNIVELFLSILIVVMLSGFIMWLSDNRKFLLMKVLESQGFIDRVVSAVQSSERLWEYIEATYRNRVGEDDEGNLDEFEMLVLFVFDSVSEWVQVQTGRKLPEGMLNTIRDLVHEIMTEVESGSSTDSTVH